MGKHAGEYGHEFGQRNLICVTEVASTTYCHIGDNEANLTDELVEYIGKVDVLMLPVDGSHHLLSEQEVDDLIAQLSPSVVVPTHYFIPEITDPLSGLKDISEWLARQRQVRSIEEGYVGLRSSDLPSQLEVWSFSHRSVLADVLGPERGEPCITTNDLIAIHETLAATAEPHLAHACGEPIRFTLRAVHECTLAEYMIAVSNPSCIYTFSMQPLSRQVMMDIPMPLAFSLGLVRGICG